MTAAARLRVLNLSYNQLTELPSQIARLTALRVLDLSANRLAELPPEIHDLSQLRQLFLHGNDALGLEEERLGPDASQASIGHRPADPAKILDSYFDPREDSS